MKQLIEKYPGATKVIVTYFLEKLLKSLDDERLPEDFKENVRKRGVEPSMIMTLAEEAPRQLFDVFDLYNIYIVINAQVHPHGIEADVTFSYEIPTYIENSEVFDTRIECEKQAILEAYEILEKSLV